jgi:hypothetical protein
MVVRKLSCEEEVDGQGLSCSFNFKFWGVEGFYAYKHLYLIRAES